MKHFWKSLLLFLALSALFPATALADTVEYPADGYHNLLFDTDTGTITGISTTKGAQYEYWPNVYTIPSEINGIPVKAIGDEAFSGDFNLYCLKIPEGVTSIGDRAFESTPYLRIVSLPSGLTRIGKRAFAQCGNLLTISLPDSVTEIDDEAFHSCFNFSIPVLPSGLKRIGKSAFNSCYGPTDLRTLPEGLTTLGMNAFEHCSGIKSLVIPSTLSNWGEGAFADCDGLTKVIISEGVSSIGKYAFDSCNNLKSVSLPSTLQSVEEGAFLSCDVLTDCVIPDGVKTIGTAAFLDVAIREIVLPDSVTSIGESAFSSIDAERIVLPKNLKKMGDYAFTGCEQLESLYIPAEMPALGKEVLKENHILKDIYFGGSQSQWKMLPGVKDSGINSLSCTIHYNASIPGRTVTPEPVPEPAMDYPFAGIQVEDYFSNTVETPACGKYSLLFNTKTGIILGAFINMRWKREPWPETYTIPAQINGVPVRGIGPGAYKETINNSHAGYQGILCRHLVIQEGVTTIGYAAFRGCINIETVSLPSSLATIGGKAFYECRGLLTAPLPDSVKVIGDDAFHFCLKLSVPVLPPRLEQVGKNAFTSCAGDSNLCVLPESLRNIGESTFSGCVGIKSLTIPGTISYIGKSAFSGCSGLTDLTISEGVTTIDKYAFDDCIHLETVFLPSSLHTIRNRAFVFCNALKDIYYEGSESQWKAVWNIPTSRLTDSSPTVHFKTSVPGRTPSQSPSVPVSDGLFTDVRKTDYFCDSVTWAVERGITKGTGEHTFSPHTPCTRAHVLTFLWRAKGAPEPTGENPYTDVPEGQYYTKAAIWACEQGLTEGGQFHGSDPCRRITAALYLWRLAGSPAVEDDPFEDTAGVYAQAAAWAAAHGITKGNSETTFNPEGICTRAQTVTFLYRADNAGQLSAGA